MLIAEYGSEGDFLWRRVSVDPVAGTVTFHHCHQPGRFLSCGVDTEYTCRLSELRGLCWSGWRHIGRVLEVVTREGRARLPQSASNFENIRLALVEGIKQGTALPWYEFPAAKALLATLVIIPSVVLCLGMCIWASEQPWIPKWVVPGFVLGVVSLIFVVSILSWWRGQPLH